MTGNNRHFVLLEVRGHRTERIADGDLEAIHEILAAKTGKSVVNPLADGGARDGSA